MTRKRIFQKTLLIICEGENTEPNYLSELKSIAIERGIWSNIVIRPTPKIETEELATKKSIRQKVKRQFDNSFKSYLMEIYGVKEGNELYEQFKQVPTRYVAEARIALKEEGFDEAWAVFDKDGHAAHTEAFELAKSSVDNSIEEEKFVKIAFSSISFEQWVLLHYEKSSIAFAKSQELIDRKLHGNNYFPAYAKKTGCNIYEQLKDKTNLALENTAWLRFKMKNHIISENIYEINPYTNMDSLVKSLLGNPNEYTWLALDESVHLKGYGAIIVSRMDDYTLKVKISKFIPHNSQNSFFLRDIEKNKIRLTIYEDDTPKVVAETGEFRLISSEIITGKTFEINLGNYRLLVEV